MHLIFKSGCAVCFYRFSFKKLSLCRMSAHVMSNSPLLLCLVGMPFPPISKPVPSYKSRTPPSLHPLHPRTMHDAKNKPPSPFPGYLRFFLRKQEKNHRTTK